MRPELRELLNKKDPISEYEIASTVELCTDIVVSHWSATHRPFEGGDMNDHGYIEALSDQNFSTAYQVQFIWQLAIWRINALFEAILSQWFPAIEPLPIRKRLIELETLGVPFPVKERAELHAWLDLRNAFSHSPPKSPSLDRQVERSDVEEFAALTLGLLTAAKPYANVRNA